MPVCDKVPVFQIIPRNNVKHVPGQVYYTLLEDGSRTFYVKIGMRPGCGQFFKDGDFCHNCRFEDPKPYDRSEDKTPGRKKEEKPTDLLKPIEQKDDDGELF